jgi:type II secretory pathway pseudopilin PulG
MSRTRRRRSAFTLLEIMVVAAIGVLVLGAALSVVLNALAWQERLDGRREARATATRVLEQVEADLAGLVRGLGNEVILAATISDNTEISGLWESGVRGQLPGAVAATGEDLAAMRFGVGGVWLRFVGTVNGPGEDGGSQPRVVSYQLIRRRTPAPRYWLHRAVVRAMIQSGRQGTWEAGWDLDPAADGALARVTAGNDGTVFGDPYGVVRPEAVENRFAPEVVDFGVRLLEAGPGGVWPAMFPRSPEEREYLGRSTSPGPGAVDVMVRVLTPAGARRLGDYEEGGVDPGSGWWEIVRANSVTLSRRIFMQGGGR